MNHPQEPNPPHQPALEPVWYPDEAAVAAANVTAMMSAVGVADVAAFHRWSVEHRADFWRLAAERVGVVFAEPYETVLDITGGVESPRWFPEARLNMVESCFTAPVDDPAIVYRHDGDIHRLTYGELRTRIDEIANGLLAAGHDAGDRIAIAMPMTVDAVVAYLAVVAIGGVVVSIADSFAPHEIATRLRLTDTRTVITQDRMRRSGRDLPMYEKVFAAEAERCIVIETGAGIELRPEDTAWSELLGDASPFTPVVVPPATHTNVLFSSGTTGEPKAIPWTQLTPIKVAVDAHLHHDITSGDVVAWPTNLGWMMGPWLIYAALANGATIALHDDAPLGPDFGAFIADAGVTMLGVVPSLVAAWRTSGDMERFDWTRITRFSSTGEASNPDDMRWLMDLAGGVPVIEYCGGTEIGGGYITATMVQPAIPSTFTTPAFGVDLILLDTDGHPSDEGEVFLVPPSIGLSTELLNRDHHEVYFAGTPAPPTGDGSTPLRRHGDHMERLPNGYYRALGRVDDTMNLGGIKVSSAELERAVSGVPGVAETAAVAVSPPGGGPSRLVIFAVPERGHRSTEGMAGEWRTAMQQLIRADLNPLFKIHDVVVVDALPRTASAKVMRRELRTGYEMEAPSGDAT